MTDRDKLIELCNKKINTMKFNNSDHWFDFVERIEKVADHLIANGVIVPPCKVGDVIYITGVFTGQIIPSEVVSIDVAENDMFLLCANKTFVSVRFQLGKTVFLTKEEAEEKLKELKRNAT